MMTANEWKNYFYDLAEVIEKNKDHLCELDRKLGDGDHGVTMSIGWQAVIEELKNDSLKNEKDCGIITMKVGRAFLNAVGSSVGPLYASGFISGAKSLKNKNKLVEEDILNFWLGFIKGVHERGNANIGDKTMLDTLLPIQRELEQNKFGNLEKFEKSLIEAKKGKESTKHMVSKKGRSSRLGERSKGVEDPGAVSAYLIFSVFMDHFQNAKNLQQQ